MRVKQEKNVRFKNFKKFVVGWQIGKEVLISSEKPMTLKKANVLKTDYSNAEIYELVMVVP